MTRVIHTGDTHMGYTQYHSPVRRQDFLDAFAAVIDDAIEGEVDAVVHAGDLFHDRRPELTDLMGTISILRRLDDAGGTLPRRGRKPRVDAGGQWLDLFERLGLATRLGDDPTVVGDTSFYGLDHVPVSRRDDLDYAFDDHDADYAALVAHGLFEPFGYADWDTETVLTESDVDFDAMLLGDNHTPDVAKVDGTWVTYPGSTERASASEREGRGYNLVTFRRRRRRGRRPRGDPAARARHPPVRLRGSRPSRGRGRGAGAREGPPTRPRRRRRPRRRDRRGRPGHAGRDRGVRDRRGSADRSRDRREEVETDAEIDVSFADPEDAVRERVEEMGLSEAAFDVEEAVRADTIPDTNVRETVKRRVEERIDDLDDLDAFDRGETVDGDAEAEDNEAELADDEAELADDETDGEPIGGKDDTATASAADIDEQVSMEDYL